MILLRFECVLIFQFTVPTLSSIAYIFRGGNKVTPRPPPSPRLPARVCDSINCSYKPRIFVFPHNYNVFQFEVDIRFSLVNFYLLSLLNALIYICKERCPQISAATLAVRWN